ncbi:MAG: dipeptide/oligopeptide/nickel ABC transporter ATP-binding protein [Candidatus Omnitrophota bacterium]|nr:dipeptide/oligopeptide/nickel ABC transporter ATP-binding protein [Candidatus Omnitrophota bacterium]
MNILQCEDIRKSFSGRTGIVKALDGVSLEIEKGSAFGLVGESGCGKTTLGKIILGILKPDSGRITLKTKRVQVVFQDPYNSLDPKMKVFDILAEGLLIRRVLCVVRRANEIKKQVEEILDLIKLSKDALNKYPHQFSGGERQRIAIGRALLTEPEFIVCDEPVSNLDVTIQLQILNLLKESQKRFGITYLFVSHDLKVIKFICDKVAVMRHGRIIESGAVTDLYSAPKDHYTRSLLTSAFYDNMKHDGRDSL